MSSIGVVVFRNSSLGHAQVLQESVNNTVNITNNDANKNVRREIIIVRKKQKNQTVPNTISVTSLLNAADSASGNLPSKKPRIREIVEEASRSPTPLAVARRNARERNRVRQVNDGFAALRRHIPEEVAAAFESANSNRGPNKKLSKVETLRMAVEYIRNLESLLNIGHADKENTTQLSMDSFPSPASSSPRENSRERNYFAQSPVLEDDDLDEDEIDGPLQPLPQHHYIDLHATDNFNIVSTPHLYDEEDGCQPMTPSSDLLGQEEINPQNVENHFAFANNAEQFTVITEQNYCSESDLYKSETNYEVKFGENIHDLSRSNFNNEPELPLESIDPELILSHDEYKDEYNSYKEDDEVFLENEQFSEIELKKELPEIQVTQEDREQFEETLKWWQEKTRQARPKNKN